MRCGIAFWALVLSLVPQLLSATGQSETGSVAVQAAEAFTKGDYRNAADLFGSIAAGADGTVVPAAAYNRGTAFAKLAESTDDPAEKRKLLNASYDDLKRSYLLSVSSAGEKAGRELIEKKARKNMQLVRKMLSELPPESKDDRQQQQNEQQQSDQQQSDQQQSDQQQSDQQQSDQQSMQQNQQDEGQQQNDQQQQNEGQQSANGSAAQSGESSDAEKQAAAEKQAEERLLGDILDREAERKARRDRLDNKGGISDVDRDW